MVCNPNCSLAEDPENHGTLEACPKSSLNALDLLQVLLSTLRQPLHSTYLHASTTDSDLHKSTILYPPPRDHTTKPYITVYTCPSTSFDTNPQYSLYPSGSLTPLINFFVFLLSPVTSYRHVRAVLYLQCLLLGVMPVMLFPRLPGWCALRTNITHR